MDALGDIETMTADSILEDTVFIELLNMHDPVELQHRLNALRRRAKGYGVLKDFDALYAAYKKRDTTAKRDAERQEKAGHGGSLSLVDGWTNFFADDPASKYPEMRCGAWIATQDGIYAQASGNVEKVACYHPIMPVERLKNVETGDEQIKLAFKRGRHWQEAVVPKLTVASASKIVNLASKGVAVTSETAKLLVKYLCDVENLNDDVIAVSLSTSKLGWHMGGDFVPYDKASFTFDGDSRFRQIYDSVKEHGDADTWYTLVKKLRAEGRSEIKFMLAASFGSALVEPLGALPFIVDTWGETETGKSVLMMLGASVWADPAENRFIGDFKSTDTALEAKADMLNSLPLFLDDTSKTSARIRDNFESVVYDLASGKGKSRSNKDLGVNRENHWRNIIITNGERQLTGYVSQGGALNRILEVECGNHIFSDPQDTADTVKRTYGHAGRRFVELVQDLDFEKDILPIQRGFQKKLMATDRMEKQAISLSVLLTADRLATDHIFKDGVYISLEEAEEVLADRQEVSDGERVYREICSKIWMNPHRFDIDTKCEKWGMIEGGTAYLYTQALTEICRAVEYPEKTFKAWAIRHGKIVPGEGGRPSRVKKIDGKAVRVIWLRLEKYEEEEPPEGDGFVQVSMADLADLPFD